MAEARMTQVRGQRLQVRETNQRCSVANDPYAKLMYYLGCVEGVKCGDFPGYMTDYANYKQLSASQKRNIVSTAKEHDPDEVLFFVEADELPDNDANKFLQLSAQEESLTAFGIHGGGMAMMGLRRELGSSKDLVKIMVHTKSWASNHYHQPLRQLDGSDSRDESVEQLQHAFMLLRGLTLLGTESTGGGTGLRKNYCGGRLNGPCDCCDGQCGPTNGCNCVDCMRKDLRTFRVCPSQRALVNREGAVSTKSAETGKFYCGRNNMRHDPMTDGYCGPENGNNCHACGQLDRQAKGRYAGIVNRWA